MIPFLKHLFCKHRYGVNRWHVTHGPNGNDPASIEVEEICLKCGKIRYRDDSIKRLEAYKTLSNEYEIRIWAYPECDHLNIALRFLLKNPKKKKQMCY